ncbi:MAG: Holliday junction resolvase RuvX [Alphaproteobacteria bacterium]|nr:Holliday junction resolvase RuvX [Alphaproteobacteria bacterium]
MTSDKQPFCTTINELISKLEPNQRLMGLDVGEKTIGMALSDVLLSIATPVDTIRRGKFTKDIQALQKIVKERNVGGFVIGYPINMNGTEGPRCQSIRQFARNIHEKLALPCFLWDERMSSLAVERMMTEGGLSRNRKAELVDKLAAGYILQGAINCRQ